MRLKLDKQFLIKYKIILLCTVCTIFALLTPLCPWLRFTLYFAIFAGGVFLSPQESFSLYAYMFFFSGLLGVEIGAYVLWGILFVGMLVKYAYHCKQGKEKIAKLPLFGSVIFYLFSILPFWNFSVGYGCVIPLALLVPIYVVYIYRDRIDAINVNKYLMSGLFVSTILGYIVYLLKWTNYIDITFGNRFQFFTNNPNYFYFGCLFIVAGLIYAIFKKRQNWWSGILLSSIVVFIGSRTMSKGFIVGLFILIFISVVIALFKNYKVGLIVLGSTIALGAVSYFCFNDYFQYMLNRFLHNGQLSISSITTDRWLIWKTFMTEQAKSPVNLLFGMGAWSEKFIEVSPGHICGCHSMYIEFFYHFGIIGTLLFFLLIYLYTVNSNQERGKGRIFVRAEDLIPLIMIFLIGIVEMIIYSQKSFFLPLSIVYIFNGMKRIPISQTEKLKKISIERKSQRYKRNKVNNKQNV